MWGGDTVNQFDVVRNLLKLAGEELDKLQKDMEKVSGKEMDNFKQASCVARMCGAYPTGEEK